MITIRPARLKDIDQLVVLLEILFSIEDDFCFDERRQRCGLEVMLANEQGHILVAEYLGDVVGMCSGQLLVSTAEGGLAVHVEDVIVKEKYRGQGIGKLLMQGIIEWARTKNVSRLQLLADKNNQDALDFYNNIGWQKTQLICLRKHI